MKFFLWLAGLIGVGLAYGFIEGRNQGVTPEQTEWQIIALVPLLLFAWWLSRPKAPEEEHKSVEKPE
jgi:hypothetical protein